MEGSLPPRASDILAVRMGKVSHPLDLQPCWLLLGLAPTYMRASRVKTFFRDQHVLLFVSFKGSVRASAVLH